METEEIQMSFCPKLLHATWSDHHLYWWCLYLTLFTSLATHSGYLLLQCPFSVTLSSSFTLFSTLLDPQWLFLLLLSAPFPRTLWTSPSSCWRRFFVPQWVSAVFPDYFITVLKNFLPAYYFQILFIFSYNSGHNNYMWNMKKCYYCLTIFIFKH